jgi:CubicO group peptidase (beta-lactamase class C family)
VAAIAAGYKAKVLCSAIFVCGRDIDPQRADEIAADSYWLLRPFRAEIDRAGLSVTASFAGISPRTATYTPRLGATLTNGKPLRAGSRVPYVPVARDVGDAWIEEPGGAALQRVVDTAFAEPNPRRLRRTRAVVVVRDGRIAAERYAPGFDRNTPLPGWSMTKSVLGALVGILIGDGRLSLADRELMPEWRAPDPRAEIRLEDLLRMRAGLRFSEVYSNPSSDVLQMLYNCRDAAAYAASRPLRAQPGTVWAYSSGTTNILSAILRRRVGDAEYLEWPRRVLFGPIGMRSAVLEPDPSGTFVCSSFMFATARDWARFGQLWADDGVCVGRRILPEGWVRFSRTPTPQSLNGNYGAHWWLKLNPELGGGTAAEARIPRDACHALGHEGQTLTIVPSLRLIAVRLGLSIHIDAWSHAQFIADLIDCL